MRKVLLAAMACVLLASITFAAPGAGVYLHGDNARKFAKMTEWGMKPIEAIQAATINAADLLGWSANVGALVTGHFADIIAVSGDPLTDVRVLEAVKFVMKGGTVVRNELAAK
jgi:imidazolonepropionase-like amidohydrolase